MRQWRQDASGDIVFGQTVSGNQALLGRHQNMLRTSPGDVMSDPEWGRDLDGQLGAASIDPKGFAAVSRAQHLKDPETQEADVVVEKRGGLLLTYAVTITSTTGQTTVYEEAIE